MDGPHVGVRPGYRLSRPPDACPLHALRRGDERRRRRARRAVGRRGAHRRESAPGARRRSRRARYAAGLALEATAPDEARALLTESADAARRVRNRWVEAFAVTEVLWLEAQQGKPLEALAGYASVVETWYRGGDWANQWLSLRHVCGILAQLGEHRSAAVLYGAIAAAGAAIALPFEPSDAERLGGLVDEFRAILGRRRVRGRRARRRRDRRRRARAVRARRDPTPDHRHAGLTVNTQVRLQARCRQPASGSMHDSCLRVQAESR